MFIKEILKNVLMLLPLYYILYIYIQGNVILYKILLYCILYIMVCTAFYKERLHNFYPNFFHLVKFIIYTFLSVFKLLTYY